MPEEPVREEDKQVDHQVEEHIQRKAASTKMRRAGSETGDSHG